MLRSINDSYATVSVPTNTLKFSTNTSTAGIVSSNLFQSKLGLQLSSINYDVTNSSTKSTLSDDIGGSSLSRVEDFVGIFSICCSTVVIFGSLVPYIPQYLKIKRSMSAEGFSTYVCLTLLLANILRIMFWFGHHFEPPLLMQSFVVIAGMLAMMEICIRVRKKGSITDSIINGSYQSGRHSSLHNTGGESQPILPVLTDSISAPASDSSSSNLSDSFQQHDGTVTLAPPTMDSEIAINLANVSTSDDSFRSESLSIDRISISQQPQAALVDQPQDIRFSRYSCVKRFWDWDDYFSYIKFLSIFTLTLATLTYLLIDCTSYIETLGFVALSTESLLGIPQLLRNHAKKSTLGMSVEMVILWLSGDLFKSLYFIIRKDPIQFTICGIVQVIIDILILIQVVWFKKHGATYRKLPK